MSEDISTLTIHPTGSRHFQSTDSRFYKTTNENKLKYKKNIFKVHQTYSITYFIFTEKNNLVYKLYQF